MLVLRILQGILIMGALLPVLTGCASRQPVSAVYILKIDATHGNQKPLATHDITGEDLADAYAKKVYQFLDTE